MAYVPQWTMAEAPQNSPMGALPPELLTRVFAFVASDRPHVDIASSRRVCQRFHAISSPFLLTTAVIAERLDTLQKLREVLDHPYFSKHVTRLVWDASYYDDWRAHDLDSYQFQCESDPWRCGAIYGYRKFLQSEEAAKTALLHGAADQSRLATQREYLDRFLDDDEKISQDLIEDRRRSDIFRTGFQDFGRRTLAQAEFRQRRLCLRYLHSAFEKLPKLRHFEFSDFRALLRAGEKDSKLCTRLFGQTLSPQLLPSYSPDDDGGSMGWSTLYDCLRNLLEISPKLKSLSFGENRLKSGDALALSRPRPDISNHIPDDDQQRRLLFRSIRHLSLPVALFLEHSKDTVSHLELDTSLYSGLSLKYWNFSAKAKPIFAGILGQTQFQALTTIVLRGWLIPLKDLEYFLLAHAITLRNMQLINCCIADASENELIRSIERKLQPALALTGVEIYALMYEARCAAMYRSLRADFTHELPNIEDDEPTEREVRSQGLLDLERTDLEDLFLGGKCNAVTRIERKHREWLAHNEWWAEEDEYDEVSSDGDDTLFIPQAWTVENDDDEDD